MSRVRSTRLQRHIVCNMQLEKNNNLKILFIYIYEFVSNLLIAAQQIRSFWAGTPFGRKLVWTQHEVEQSEESSPYSQPEPGVP